MVSDSAMTIRNRLRHALVDRTATRAERRACFFTTLYETEFDHIYAYLRYRVRDAAAAEDLATEVFARAWRNLDTLRDPDRAAAWLFRTARNLVTDHYRATSPADPLDTLHPGQHPCTESPERLVLAGEQAATLWECLLTLPDREREIIGLRFVAGLRHRETARVMGISEGNVAKLLHRALQKIRVHLQSEEDYHV